MHKGIEPLKYPFTKAAIGTLGFFFLLFAVGKHFEQDLC
jgi:hypothetical protein